LLRFIIRKALASPFHFRRRKAAGIIAAGNLLDLDHVGAHIGEQHASRRTRHDVREFEDLESGQRSHQRPRNRGGCFDRNARRPSP